MQSLFDQFLLGFYEQQARRRMPISRTNQQIEVGTLYEDPGIEAKNNQWRRILLLVVAITVSFRNQVRFFYSPMSFI